MGGWTALIPICLIFPVGFALHYLQEGEVQAMPELQVFAVYGLQASGAVFGLIFLFNLVAAPYRNVSDELSSIRSIIGVDKPIIRPDLTLAEAIAIIRKTDRYKDITDADACMVLSDWVGSQQIKLWGRDGDTSAFSYPVGSTEEEKEKRYGELVKSSYSRERAKVSPLLELSDFKSFKKQYIVHALGGENLLVNGNSGAWINKYVGSAVSKFDLRFSRVEIAKALLP